MKQRAQGVLFAGVLVVAAACVGPSSDVATVDQPAATVQMTTASLPTTSTTSTAPPPEATNAVETVVTITPPTAPDPDQAVIDIVWIGGSDVELEGRSLVDAVSRRLPTIANRRLELVGDITIGPLPSEIRDRVIAAAARDVDGLIVPMNPAWATWTGHRECAGITPPHTFYACILTPPSPDVVDGLLDDVRALIDEIVATGLPTYMYVISHSAESVVAPDLASELAAAESALASLDPGVAHIEFIGEFLNRRWPDMHEGAEFNDMVHLSDLGIEVVADQLVGELNEFFAQQIG